MSIETANFALNFGMFTLALVGVVIGIMTLIVTIKK